MKNNTKFLLTENELRALRCTDWVSYIEKAVKNDPDWGFTGSGDHYVVYFNVELPATRLISIGMDIQKQIISSQL